MIDPEKRRAAILAIIVGDTPRDFWADGLTGARQAYPDVFQQVRHDPNLIDDQRIDFLYQSRHFRMEHLLKRLAERHGVAYSPTLLVDNGRKYVFASKGRVGITQAYVPAIGDMPKPARFRERHSALNAIVAAPSFDFGLEPAELLLPKQFYGVITHNPVGRRFEEVDQALGMIQFCVPVAGCTSWAAQFTLHEIVAAYAVEKPEAKPERGPDWKRHEDGKRDEG